MAGKSNESLGSINQSCFKELESPQSQFNNWWMQVKELSVSPWKHSPTAFRNQGRQLEKHRRERFYGSNPKYLNLRQSAGTEQYKSKHSPKEWLLTKQRLASLDHSEQSLWQLPADPHSAQPAGKHRHTPPGDHSGVRKDTQALISTRRSCRLM